MALCIHDGRLPQPIVSRLKSHHTLMPLPMLPAAYEPVCAHPDLFITVTGNAIVTAPCVPAQITRVIRREGYQVITGAANPGPRYPASAAYCAATDVQYFIHNTAVTDPALLKSVLGLTEIRVKQGYTRCSLMLLPGRRYLTSDPGIDQVLKANGLTGLLINPRPILLPGFGHGFFGGCCGVSTNRLYLTGSLGYFENESSIRQLVAMSGLELIELAVSAPLDCGSLIFLDAGVSK